MQQITSWNKVIGSEGPGTYSFNKYFFKAGVILSPMTMERPLILLQLKEKTNWI